MIPYFEELSHTDGTVSLFHGRRVDVYRNLRKHCWSVRDSWTRKVLCHTSGVSLGQVTFHVSEKGRQRVLREKRKNVHAVVRGTISTQELVTRSEWMIVKYNPYEAPTFLARSVGRVSKRGAQTTRGARRVRLTFNGALWAKDVVS